MFCRLDHRGCRLGLMAAVILCLVCISVHQLLLQCIASQLIDEDVREDVDTLILVSGDRMHEVACDLYHHQQVHDIVLLKQPALPLIRYHIVESHERVMRRLLTDAGVPPYTVTIAPGEVWHLWDCASRIRERLQKHPNKRIAVAIEAFDTRRLRLALERSLSTTECSSVKVYALRDRRFDESNWWRHRMGIKAVANGLLRLSYTAVMGKETRVSRTIWTLEAFEKTFVDAGSASSLDDDE